MEIQIYLINKKRLLKKNLNHLIDSFAEFFSYTKMLKSDFFNKNKIFAFILNQNFHKLQSYAFPL